MVTISCAFRYSVSGRSTGTRQEVDCFVALLLAMTSGMPVPENEMKVIGLAGWSGAGKTTLLARVIPHLLSKGLRVSVIKHAHHSFDVDVPGKDSWVHRQSGA